MIIMTVAVIPLTFLVGFGVDYGRAEMLQTQMNAAADAAALAGVDPSMILESDATAATAATNMFNAQVAKLAGVDSFQMTPQVIDGTTNSSGALGYQRKVIISYTAKTHNLFGGILGRPTLTISGQSAASAEQPPNINFYLAMDNSPSMLLPASSSGLADIRSATSTSHLSNGCDFACHEQMPHTDNIYVNDQSGNQVLLSTGFYTAGGSKEGVWYRWNPTTRVVYDSAGNPMGSTSTSTGSPTTTTSTRRNVVTTTTTVTSTTSVVTYSITDSTSGPVTITQTTVSTPTTTTTTQVGTSEPTTSTSTGRSSTSSSTYDTGYWADGYWLTHNYGKLYGSPSNVNLRKDEVVYAASQLIPFAANQANQYHVTYNMQLFAFNWTHPSTSGPVATLNAMTDVNAFGSGFSVSSLFPADDYWWKNSMPTSGSNNNDQGTEFANTLSKLNNLMPTAGTGASNSTPQEILFLVTDGMTDEPLGGGRSHGPLNSTDLAQCTAIKAKGVKIAILYTQYLPDALTGDSWSQNNIAPYLTPTDQVLTALQQCASPGANGNPLVQSVTTDGDITAALLQLFSTALQAPRLVQ